MTSSKNMFMLTMIMSTIMVTSSMNWMNMWIGLEINLMSFIPMMSKSKNSFLSQSMMMYFLIQSMASMMFIVILLMNKYMFINMKEHFISTMMIMPMMMKMGMPPFHMWFPEIMYKMEWNMCFLLMSWQKIAPMYIMSMLINMSNTMMLMICVSSMTGAIGGLNQTSTKKMMAYSSMNHMSWMVACACTFKKSWMVYMMMYMIMMMMFCMIMYLYNIMYLNQMNIFFTTYMDKITMLTLILSIGGIPPFLGFMPKWIAIQYMISSSEFMMMTIMMLSSLITLSYYLRITLSMNLIMSHSQKWMYNMKNNKMYSMLLLITNTSLPLFIFLMNF